MKEKEIWNEKRNVREKRKITKCRLGLIKRKKLPNECEEEEECFLMNEEIL